MRNLSRGATFAGAIAALITALQLGVMPTASEAQTSKPPRTADGKPNLNGIWQVLNTAAWDIQDHVAAPGPMGLMVVTAGSPPGQSVVEGNDIPYQPWAA